LGQFIYVFLVHEQTLTKSVQWGYLSDTITDHRYHVRREIQVRILRKIAQFSYSAPRQMTIFLTIFESKMTRKTSSGLEEMNKQNQHGNQSTYAPSGANPICFDSTYRQKLDLNGLTDIPKNTLTNGSICLRNFSPR
jgi:hypothetical protein